MNPQTSPGGTWKLPDQGYWKKLKTTLFSFMNPTFTSQKTWYEME